MTVFDILNGTSKAIRKNLDLLAKDYLLKTGRKVCFSCPSDVQYMILSLKNIYKMTQFKFRRHAAMYKNKKGDKTTISNGTMTDEKALKFLKTNPKRIELFSAYPSNWKTLIKGKIETEAEKDSRLASEAEAVAAAKAAAKAANSGGVDLGDGSSDSESEAEREASLAAEKEALRSELLVMSLADLRAKYTDVKATSIVDFIDKVLAG